jgi:D-aminoacyl-tRNA deacylase
MTVVIISSTEDPASTHIKHGLLHQTIWEKQETRNNTEIYRHAVMKDVILFTISQRMIFQENLDRDIEQQLGQTVDQLIFISRHRSETGLPTLTTHPIGNYGEAEFGGTSFKLPLSSPRLMTLLLRQVKTNAAHANLYHKVSFEVTHHGPYLTTPSLFVEVGSNEEEWKKQQPADVIAQSLIELLQQYHTEKDCPKDIPILIGIGGGHYAPRFTDIIFERNAAFGHMIPTYQIKAGNLNEDMFRKALHATPGVTAVYMHKKFLKKSQVTQYKKWCQNQGISAVSSKDLPPLD